MNAEKFSKGATSVKVLAAVFIVFLAFVIALYINRDFLRGLIGNREPSGSDAPQSHDNQAIQPTRPPMANPYVVAEPGENQLDRQDAAIAKGLDELKEREAELVAVIREAPVDYAAIQNDELKLRDAIKTEIDRRSTSLTKDTEWVTNESNFSPEMRVRFLESLNQQLKTTSDINVSLFSAINPSILNKPKESLVASWPAYSLLVKQIAVAHHATRVHFLIGALDYFSGTIQSTKDQQKSIGLDESRWGELTQEWAETTQAQKNINQTLNAVLALQGNNSQSQNSVMESALESFTQTRSSLGKTLQSNRTLMEMLK